MFTRLIPIFTKRTCFLILLANSALIGTSSCQKGSTKAVASVRIAVPGTPLTYLPIYLARDLGYYEEQQLNVTMDEVQGGPKALQAMFGGSVDVAAGFYELTVQMAAEGHRVVSFLTMLERPGFALVVSPASSRKVKRLEDLRGAAIGVSTPGSASHQLVNYLLAQHHIPLKDVSISGIGLGATAVAAIERGRIDAATLIGSGLSTVEQRFPNIVVLADTRTPARVKEIFGTDTYPSHSLLSTPDWLRANEQTARKLTHAIEQAMLWMRQHSPAEIRDHIPAQYRAPDAAADIEALRVTIPMLSQQGTVSPAGAEAVRRVLDVSSARVREARIDLLETYTNRFAASTGQ